MAEQKLRKRSSRHLHTQRHTYTMPSNIKFSIVLQVATAAGPGRQSRRRRQMIEIIKYNFYLSSNKITVKQDGIRWWQLLAKDQSARATAAILQRAPKCNPKWKTRSALIYAGRACVCVPAITQQAVWKIVNIFLLFDHDSDLLPDIKKSDLRSAVGSNLMMGTLLPQMVV